MKAPLYRVLARTVAAHRRCVARSGQDGSAEKWADRHEATLTRLVNRHMPHGSGFDNGTSLVLRKSTSETLAFVASFHHLDEHGSYCGWTSHLVFVKASLENGFTLRVTGRDRRGIKEYIAEVFSDALRQDVDE